jgi:hypothetical protein
MRRFPALQQSELGRRIPDGYFGVSYDSTGVLEHLCGEYNMGNVCDRGV